jgi:uncharacterized cupin superfamily protein
MTSAGPHDAPFHVDDVPPATWEFGELRAVRRRLGAHAGAHRLGIALIEVAPGARATPPHAHADEDELFLVLEGDGLSWQSRGSRHVATHEIRAGDVLFHESSGPAHTVIAGERGLTVLVLAEGSRTGITYVPRTKQFWLGPRWVPADGPSPFQADAAAGPLEVPAPSPRPATIVALDDCEVQELRVGRFAAATRDGGRAAGARRIVLAVDDLPPGTIATPLHWHTRSEEAFLVRRGTGIARIGDAEHAIGPGSFFLRPPASGVGHRIEAGPEGLEYVTLGDRPAGDVAVYPDSRKIAVRPGVFLPISDLSYWDGEPDAQG